MIRWWYSYLHIELFIWQPARLLRKRYENPVNIQSVEFFHVKSVLCWGVHALVWCVVFGLYRANSFTLKHHLSWVLTIINHTKTLANDGEWTQYETTKAQILRSTERCTNHSYTRIMMNGVVNTPLSVCVWTYKTNKMQSMRYLTYYMMAGEILDDHYSLPNRWSGWSNQEEINYLQPTYMIICCEESMPCRHENEIISDLYSH